MGHFSGIVGWSPLIPIAPVPDAGSGELEFGRMPVIQPPNLGISNYGESAFNWGFERLA